MAEKTFQSDVVVVGAGPAGCVLSYLLARSGVHVTLLERESDLKREFRGYFFQPLVARLFDQMDILQPLLDQVDHEKTETLYIDVFGRKYPSYDFRVLSQSPDYALIINQPPLLRFLIDQASQYENFEFYNETSVLDLIHDNGSVVGVSARNRSGNEEWDIQTRLVVGADGRYSATRKAAGIDPGLGESEVDLVWFKIPEEAIDKTTMARLGANGILFYIPLGDEIQVGWVIEAGTYPSLREQGIEKFRYRVADVDPALEGVLDEVLDSFDQCSLLHPAPGMSEQWVQEGLLLIGDAAHVASPFGAQGNSLAIQDAVAAHPVIVNGLQGENGPLSTHQLQSFEQSRRSAVETIMDAQESAGKVIELYTKYNEKVPPTILKYLLWAVYGTFARFPSLSKNQTQMLAFGSEPIQVDREILEQQTTLQGQ